jgi:predicted transcriptional regulator
LANIIIGTHKLNSQHLQLALLRHDKDLSNKGARRGRLDVISEILFFCEQEKTKTSIMYNTNLNYSQLKMHIDTLISQGLLTKKFNKYVTSEKGYQFLDLFARLTDLLVKFDT